MELHGDIQLTYTAFILQQINQWQWLNEQCHHYSIRPSKRFPLLNASIKSTTQQGKPIKSELIIHSPTWWWLHGVVRFNCWRTSAAPRQVWRSRSNIATIGFPIMEYCAKHTLTENDYCFAYAHSPHKTSLDTPIYCRSILNSYLTSLRVLYERYSNSGKDLIPMQYQQNC